MKIIDLFKFIQYIKGDLWFMCVKIKYKLYCKVKFLLCYLGLLICFFLKGFIGWVDDIIQKMGVYFMIYIDVFWYYVFILEGKFVKMIDEVLLDWCFGEGIVIDMKYKLDFEVIIVKDIRDFLVEYQLEIKLGMIVLIKIGRDKYMGI